METLVANLAGKTRRERWLGRDYLVAPLTLIVPGVLPGSKGPLYYPPDEVAREPDSWNHVPIVVYHPTLNGTPTTARRPDVLERQGVGYVFNAGFKGKLRGEGWFDIERTKLVDPRVLTALEAGNPFELSTGLYTDNEPAPGGSVFNSASGPRPYTYIARNYRPDHLAILPDRKGACSVADGCGVLVNQSDISSGNTSEEHITLDDLPVSNARKPSRMLDISPEKACQILKDGAVRGKELTARQRGLFGVICGRRGKKPTGNSAEDFDPEELDYELAVDELSLMAQDGELPAEEFVGNEASVSNEAHDDLGDVAVNLMDPMPQAEPYGTPTQYSIAPSAYTTGVKGADEASGKARVDSHLAMDRAGHRAAAKSHLKAAMAHLDGAQNVVAGSGSMSMPQLDAHLDAARQHTNAARLHAGNCATSAESTQNQLDNDFDLEISSVGNEGA